ncbi:MAG: M23 family metallopeptidase [Candidatus Promineifilaceae bacterium]
MKHKEFRLLVGVVILGFLVMMLSGFAMVSDNGTNGDWYTYHDSVYDFSVDYPSDWDAIPRTEETAAGEVIMFRQSSSAITDPENHHDSLPFVAIGFYFVAWDEHISITEWTEKYNKSNSVLDASELYDKQSYEIEVDKLTALYVEGTSPLTAFRYVNIPRGKMVWFIWSNMNTDKASTFSSLIASFRFGEATPETLQDIFGDEFSPFPLGNSSEDSPTKDNEENQDATMWFPTRQTNLNGWRVPLSGGTWNATCNSSYHNNNRSRYAIDVPRPEGTSVYAANSGTVLTLGWDAGGFGNYVKIQTSSYYHYYAHLSSFDESILFPPRTIAKGARVGYSGNTGQSSGAHLHFEVRNSSNVGVSLVGMSGFTDSCLPLSRQP